MSRSAEKSTQTKQSYHHPLVYLFGLLGFLTFVGIGYFFQLVNDPEKFPIQKIAVDGEFLNLKTTDVEELVSQAVVGGFFSLDVALFTHQDPQQSLDRICIGSSDLAGQYSGEYS